MRTFVGCQSAQEYNSWRHSRRFLLLARLLQWLGLDSVMHDLDATFRIALFHQFQFQEIGKSNDAIYAEQCGADLPIA